MSERARTSGTEDGERFLCPWRIAIDTGGTFTDLVALDEATWTIANIKLPSTPRKPDLAVIEACRKFLANTNPAQISMMSHATTIAVNALLGQLGLELPKIALITTEGFRDIVEIGRQRRPELYSLFTQRPRMLVPRRHRYEIRERIGPAGEVILPLDRTQVRRLSNIIKREKFQAVAIGLLNAHINPAHEKAVKSILRRICPDVPLVASTDVAPEYREFERISTTVVNACLMPIVSGYVEDLSNKISELGINAPFLIMQSSGGMASKAMISEKPVSMIESGPASGCIASAFYGKILGVKNVIGFDMGGTTAKASVIRGGTPEVTTEYEVAGRVHSGRIIKGSGYPVRYPFIDLAECSAGGGTIAWTDQGGAIRVGPLSAGADPGPACYGKGGTEPTVTDANLVLGRLNPGYLLAGEMRLYSEMARHSIANRICKATGLEVVQAAAGIIRIVNSNMAKILRIVSVERGYDPRLFHLVAFGGAGPMHACALAEELGISEVMVPRNPGLFSAWGLLATDFSYSVVRSVMKAADKIEPKTLEELFQDLEAECLRAMKSQALEEEGVAFIRQLDMRYFGQGYELSILTGSSSQPLPRLVDAFHSRHEALYGYMVRDEVVELVNVRVVGVRALAKPRLAEMPLSSDEPPREALLHSRDVYFEQQEDYVKCPVFAREKLSPGNKIPGPAIIEQHDATTVLYPGWTARIDRFAGIHMIMERPN